MAAGHYQRGFSKHAAKSYTEFLKTYPSHKEATSARYALAICEFRQNNLKEAAALIDQVLRDSKFDRADEALAVQGHCLMTLGEREQALASFARLLKSHARSKHAPTAAVNRIQVLYLLDRKADSATAGKAFLKQFGNSSHAPAASYFLALAQHDLG